MKNDLVYLTIHQGFALVSKIDELKENPYFRDDIAEEFTKEVFEQAKNITVNSLYFGTDLRQKLKKNGDKIKISRSKFEYITRLTGSNVFDKEVMNKHMDKLKQVEALYEENKSKTR